MVVTWPTTSGADTYNIRYGTNPTSLTQTAINVTSPATITGLTGGTTYYFRVIALNNEGSGNSLQSTNQLSATAIPAIAAPTGVTAIATPGQIVINWNSVAGASSYEVLRGTVTGTYTSLASNLNTTTYTDAVPNGTAYFYVVRAWNTLPSANSAEVTRKAIASFAITSITSPTPNSLQVNWTASPYSRILFPEY